MKKVVALMMTAVMILTLSACGGGANTAPASDNNTAAEDAEKQEESAAESAAGTEDTAEEGTAATEETGAETTEPAEPVRVVVGVSATSELNKAVWETIANKVKEEGVELEIRDYSEGGVSLAINGDVDLCEGSSRQAFASDERYAGFQNAILPVGYTTVIPFNLYSWKYESMDDLEAGDSIYIDLAIDDGGYASKRSANVLEAAGLITIKDESEMPDYTSFYVDHYIKENLRGITFETMPQEAIEGQKETIGAFLSPRKEDGTVIFEDPVLQDEEQWSLLWVNAEKAEDKDFLDAVGKIVEAYQSQEVMELYESSGSPAVPVGWDVDLIGQ